MPIANVSTLYQRIAKGSEGGNEFARFIKLLLNAECARKGEQLVAESDASGDFRKLDASVSSENSLFNLLTGYQFKFYPANLTSKHKHEIKKGIEDAIEMNIGLREYILVTPEDWHKSDQYWFNELKNQHEKSKSIRIDGSVCLFNFKLIHWGHNKIIELALKHDHIGVHYFPELFPFGVGKFKLASANIDCLNCNWYQNDRRPKTDYYQSYTNSREGLMSDPLFDFCFTNNTPEIFLLNKIELYIEEITSQIKGIPAAHLLKSIGCIEHEVDFTIPVNLITLSDPLIFEANKPMRFQLLLKNFTKKCPGNCVKMKFWFHFNSYSIPTDSYYLGF